MGGKRKNYSKELVLEAIKDSKTIMSTIAKRLNCDWMTAQKYVNKWDETRQAYEHERQTMIDYAEGKLFEQIKKGDSSCIKWFLSKKAKDRDYGDELQDALKTAMQDTNLHIVID